MKDRPHLPELILLAGMVAGMLLAAVALSLGDSVLPKELEKFVQRQTFHLHQGQRQSIAQRKRDRRARSGREIHWTSFLIN